MKIKNLILLLVLGLSLALVGCDDDDEPSLCGNGAIDPGEACDSSNINNTTCSIATGGNMTGGVPTCTSACTIDVSTCREVTCGDGIADGDELCDGTDLGDNASCSDVDSDAWEAGQGTLACDNCRYDFDGCVYTCEIFIIEDEFCDDTDPYSCCDHNGSPAVCGGVWQNADDQCFQTCESQTDCGWSVFCVQGSLMIGDICYEPTCGTNDPTKDFITSTVNTTCGGTDYAGWCAAGVDDAGWLYGGRGTCKESGTVIHGGTCVENQVDEMGVDVSTKCLNGECLAGACVQYCNPEDELAQTKTCPATTNCVEYNFLNGETAGGDYFIRTLGTVCEPVGTNPSCSLLNGDILDGTGGTDCGSDECKVQASSFAPDPGYVRMIGTLIGKCETVATVLNAGDTCTITTDGTDSCPSMHACMYSDPMNDGTDLECVQACDTNDGTDGGGTCTGGDACISASIILNVEGGFVTPNFVDGGVTYSDVKNKLGFCVPAQ
jgi:hypothetical protein